MKRVGEGARTKEAGADLQQMLPQGKERCQLGAGLVKQQLLISFEDEADQEDGGMDVSSYGTLFQRRDQLVPSTPPALPPVIRVNQVISVICYHIGFRIRS